MQKMQENECTVNGKIVQIRFGVTKYEVKKNKKIKDEQDSKQFDVSAPSLFRSLLFGVSLQFSSLCLCLSLRVPLFGGMSPQGP